MLAPIVIVEHYELARHSFNIHSDTTAQFRVCVVSVSCAHVSEFYTLVNMPIEYASK